MASECRACPRAEYSSAVPLIPRTGRGDARYRVVMGQGPARKNEIQHVTPAKAGVHVREELDSRSPAFAEDKLRGNDVTFDGANFGPCAPAPRSGTLF
jgi:hypothetical protein